MYHVSNRCDMKLSKEFKIGAFVIAILVASFILINYLRGEDIFNREIEITARYDNVEGLVASAPVYIKGFKAGKVIEVSYDTSEDDFVVTCSVLKDFFIPVDSRMIIYGVDIMGGKGVRIDLGSSAVDIEDGGVLASGSEPALLDGLAAGMGPLMAKLGNTLDSLNVTVTSVNRIVNDRNIEKTLAHFERTMSDIRSIAAGLEGKSDELNTFIDNLCALSEKFGVIAEKADTTIQEVSSLVASVDENEINEVITSFRNLLNNINDPEGTIGKLLADDSVYNSVDELLNDIDSLVRKIQENPKKYIRISVF
ncbi:MAG: MCE family protein [Bacteroidales bacterium]|nr:MCE family protein [Bacteroidales bacterium]